MTFFALLAIAIGVLSALGLVLVGLLEMPWPLLLVGLLAVLYGFQRLTAAETADSPLAEPPNATVTRLATTKQAITKQGPLPSVASSTQGASKVDISAATSQAAAQSDELIYRGVRYRVGSSAKVRNSSS